MYFSDKAVEARSTSRNLANITPHSRFRSRFGEEMSIEEAGPTLTDSYSTKN